MKDKEIIHKIFDEVKLTFDNQPMKSAYYSYIERAHKQIDWDAFSGENLPYEIKLLWVKAVEDTTEYIKKELPCRSEPN